MSRSLFEELKRRNVYKVGVAYLVLAWVVIQVTSIAVPALHLPDWVNSAVFLFGALGFPFALFFAWEFEITHEGVKRESEIAPEDSIAAHTGRKLDFIIIGLLVITLSYFIYESRFETQTTETLIADKISSDVETSKEVGEHQGSSIAVLPFVNMSSDKEQEYFSDGISEEILNVLAKIPNLHVTSRSSAFSFKGKDIIVSEIAKKLGVNNVLEGSVRKSGNRIRITAQLIEAGSDKHLWSETYDRELTDIFAIQDEISAAIVEALKSKLGLNISVTSRDMSKVNLDAHNEYLKGRFYIENRNQADVEKALAHFDNAIALAPEYAQAWMGKGWASSFLSENNYGNISQEDSEQMSRPAAEKALALAPNLPEAHAILGLIELDNGNNNKAMKLFRKAIELNPNYADAMIWLGFTMLDQPKKRFELFHKAVQINPMSLLATNNYGNDLVLYGRINEAREVVEHMLSINDSHHLAFGKLGKIYLTEGNYAEAIVAFEKQIDASPEYISARFNAASTLATIELEELAASKINKSGADAVKYWFKGNAQLYIDKVREVFPRSENDSLGYWVRGRAEARLGNYTEAAKYYKLTKSGEFENLKIYSYQQIGDTKASQALLEKAKLQFKSWLDVDAKYSYTSSMLQPVILREMEIAYLDGDIDKAMVKLKMAMKKDYIMNFEYKANAVYKKLRAHPEWPAIIAESDRRAAVQRDIYLKLVAEKNKIVH